MGAVDSVQSESHYLFYGLRRIDDCRVPHLLSALDWAGEGWKNYH